MAPNGFLGVTWLNQISDNHEGAGPNASRRDIRDPTLSRSMHLLIASGAEMKTAKSTKLALSVAIAAVAADGAVSGFDPPRLRRCRAWDEVLRRRQAPASRGRVKMGDSVGAGLGTRDAEAPSSSW